MKVIAASPATLWTAKIPAAYIKNIFQTSRICAESLRKIAAKDRGIPHRIVNLGLNCCRAHIKSFCDLSGALCTSLKMHAKSLLQPPSISGNGREEVVLSPDLPLPFRRSYRHLFCLDACEA